MSDLLADVFLPSLSSIANADGFSGGGRAGGSGRGIRVIFPHRMNSLRLEPKGLSLSLSQEDGEGVCPYLSAFNALRIQIELASDFNPKIVNPEHHINRTVY